VKEKSEGENEDSRREASNKSSDQVQKLKNCFNPWFIFHALPHGCPVALVGRLSLPLPLGKPPDEMPLPVTYIPSLKVMIRSSPPVSIDTSSPRVRTFP